MCLNQLLSVIYILKIYCMITFTLIFIKLQSLTVHKRPSYLLLGSKMAPSHHHCTCTLPAKPALASHDTSATTVVCMCFHAIKDSGHSNLPELLHDVYISPSCVGAPFLFCILHAQDPTIQTQDTKLLSFFSFGSYIIWNSPLLISGTAQHFCLSKQISNLPLFAILVPN